MGPKDNGNGGNGNDEGDHGQRDGDEEEEDKDEEERDEDEEDEFAGVEFASTDIRYRKGKKVSAVPKRVPKTQDKYLENTVVRDPKTSVKDVKDAKDVKSNVPVIKPHPQNEEDDVETLPTLPLNRPELGCLTNRCKSNVGRIIDCDSEEDCDQ